MGWPASYRPLGRRGLGLGGSLVLAGILVLAGMALALPCSASRAEMVEPPALAERVAAGTLPPVNQRLPIVPAVEAGEPGKYGGELHTLIASARDTRVIGFYGYARLMAYTPEHELVPDILQSVDDDGDRVFTLHLRAGQKWSDGAPFTTEDFRYWWQDVALNPNLSPSGPPIELLIDGERPRVEILDETTIRFSWSKPNPTFLGHLAGPAPLQIFRPAHYLKQFNAKYAAPAMLDELVKQARVRNWGQLHNRLDNMTRNDNPDLPTLDPWVLTTRPPSDRFVFERNPYYYRIDRNGMQLPYIDRIIASIADAKIIPAKVGLGGESDLQARYLRFDNYTFLKDGEERNDFSVRLWRTGYGSQLALYPNLNVKDPIWQALMRDVRFRRALSMAIDRHEINQVIYYGLGIEGQNTMLPGSPLASTENQKAWAHYDSKAANRLLDEIGLTKRDGEGIRLMPDGRPLEIIIETAGDSSEQSDVLELIRDTWREIGIKLFTKPEQVEVLHNRIFAGETMMTIDKGLDDGLATPAMTPRVLAPTQQEGWEWPRWGQYFETKGKSGEPPDLPAAVELLALERRWHETISRDERKEIWQRMLAIHADQVFTIGTVAGVPQPVVVNNRLHNVPVEGIYNYDPGAHFGVYKPDHFWLSPPPGDTAKAAAAEPPAGSVSQPVKD
ncbi:MAG TPA: ABC transporter substrate-binding protein [Stellaceae bacterium]|nr:ABC transporter substrate-binding protein [Stellaceae bacterium]